ncbi:MAG: hypothetical protein V2I32_06405 [Desulforhopalus sp.]|jgi:hypothetical protein|nr:hypothetical protein [Desulforhopalus sp.]
MAIPTNICDRAKSDMTGDGNQEGTAAIEKKWRTIARCWGNVHRVIGHHFMANDHSLQFHHGRNTSSALPHSRPNLAYSALLTTHVLMPMIFLSVH